MRNTRKPSEHYVKAFEKVLLKRLKKAIEKLQTRIKANRVTIKNKNSSITWGLAYGVNGKFCEASTVELEKLQPILEKKLADIEKKRDNVESNEEEDTEITVEEEAPAEEASDIFTDHTEILKQLQKIRGAVNKLYYDFTFNQDELTEERKCDRRNALPGLGDGDDPGILLAWNHWFPPKASNLPNTMRRSTFQGYLDTTNAGTEDSLLLWDTMDKLKQENIITAMNKDPEYLLEELIWLPSQQSSMSKYKAYQTNLVGKCKGMRAKIFSVFIKKYSKDVSKLDTAYTEYTGISTPLRQVLCSTEKSGNFFSSSYKDVLKKHYDKASNGGEMRSTSNTAS